MINSNIPPAERKLIAALRRLQRVIGDCKASIPRDTPIVYKPPKNTKYGYVCSDCGRPKSDSGSPHGLCIFCYRMEARAKYYTKLYRHELRRQILESAISKTSSGQSL